MEPEQLKGPVWAEPDFSQDGRRDTPHAKVGKRMFVGIDVAKTELVVSILAPPLH